MGSVLDSSSTMVCLQQPTRQQSVPPPQYQYNPPEEEPSRAGPGFGSPCHAGCRGHHASRASWAAARWEGHRKLLWRSHHTNRSLKVFSLGTYICRSPVTHLSPTCSPSKMGVFFPVSQSCEVVAKSYLDKDMTKIKPSAGCRLRR